MKRREAASVAQLPSAQPLGVRVRYAELARRLAGGAALLAVAVGALVLLGWGLDNARLKSLVPGAVTMMPITAVSFGLAGVALWMVRHDDAGASARRVATACAAAVIAAGVLTLLEYRLGWNLQIDRLLFRDAVLVGALRTPGRMAPATAVNFLLFGCALLLLDRPGLNRLRTVLVHTMVGVSLIALAGYVYGVDSFYQLGISTPMAVHTAATFAVLAAGLLCARPARGGVGILTSATSGGVALRRLLPVALVAPILLGWLSLAGQRRGWYGREFGVALVALLASGVVALIAWWSARRLHHRDNRRAQMEAALRESETKFRLLTEQSLVGVVVMQAGRFKYVNPALVRMIGYSRDELLSASSVLEFVAEDDRALVRENLRRREQGETPSIHYSFRVRTKDGGMVDFEVFGSRILLDDGPAVLSTILDITERKRSDDRLREQAELLDHAQDAIVVRDLDGRVTYWNKSAERLYGWTAGEVVGQPVVNLTYRDSALFRRTQDHVVRTGEWAGEQQQTTRDGRNITVESRWTLVRDAAGRPTSILVINTDITERKQIEQQFMRAQRLETIGTLTSGIAHDLNNVLAPIMMSIDLLRESVTREDGRALLDTIGGSAKRGADIVAQVLAFGRGMGGRRVAMQAKDLVGDMEKIARETFPKNIEVRTAVESDVWPLTGDPTQLHQVLLNLCVNARDAMPEGGQLTITAENITLDAHDATLYPGAKPGPHVVIQLEDSGTGIQQDVIDKIFDPFFSTKEPGKGTGLGLSTSLTIVKSHGGFMRVYSEPGAGTRFLIYLPVGSERSGEAFADQPTEPARGRGELVLVVDDEAVIRQITRQTLELSGYRVLIAANGAEAVTLYAERQQDISVVVIDMMMPVMDGATAIQVLQKMDPAVRIIAVSGLATDEKATRAAAAGARRFLAKPYTAAQLLTTLQQALADG